MGEGRQIPVQTGLQTRTLLQTGAEKSITFRGKTSLRGFELTQANTSLGDIFDFCGVLSITQCVARMEYFTDHLLFLIGHSS